MIDTGRIDTSKPIDLATIANTKVFPIEPNFHHFGVNLTDEVTYLNGGIFRLYIHFCDYIHKRYFDVNLIFLIKGADCFASKVNIEVQWASEQTIAAVERHGGVITTAYYDIISVTALCDAEKWFKSKLIYVSKFPKPRVILQFHIGNPNLNLF